MKEKIWYLYIILTHNNKYYTGITTDIQRRFDEHSGDSKKGAKYLKANTPSKIVHQESFKNRSEATKRELQIKKLSRKQKEELIFSQEI